MDNSFIYTLDSLSPSQKQAHDSHKYNHSRARTHTNNTSTQQMWQNARAFKKLLYNPWKTAASSTQARLTIVTRVSLIRCVCAHVDIDKYVSHSSPTLHHVLQTQKVVSQPSLFCLAALATRVRVGWCAWVDGWVGWSWLYDWLIGQTVLNFSSHSHESLLNVRVCLGRSLNKWNV